MASEREETLRAAEKLLRQGKLDAAIAEYRKVIDEQPNDWNTANTLGDLYFRAGQTDKAVAEYSRIADHLANEGFFQKAVAVYRKIIKIKPEDERSMWQLGGLAARQGLLVDARANFLALIDRRRARGDARGEAEARAELGDLEGADVETRIAGAHARVQLGDRQTAVLKLKQAAADLEEKGKEDDARRLLAEAAALEPAIVANKPAVETKRATDNTALLWTLAEMEMRAGRVDEGRRVLHQILERDPDPGKLDKIVELGCSVAEENPDAGFECVDLVASAAIADDKWDAAAAAIGEFVGRVPQHIPSVMRLVEICVDAGLESTMHVAQAQLADAYLAARAGLEARMIAEDLLAREPWEPTHLDRLRQALTLLGEQDIDAIVAARIGPQPSTGEQVSAEPAPPAAAPLPAAAALPQPEVDLSDVLGDLRKAATGIDTSAPLEDVFESLRREAVRDVTREVADQHMKLAETYVDMGLALDAIKALEVAARSPRFQFRASAMIAKLYVDANDGAHAIEWYERAAEAPAPSTDAHHALLYDLGSFLETQGEHARALAVLLELQAEAGDYRDLTAKLGHLTAELKR